MNAINKIYLPTQPIYKKRAVILLDKPNTKEKEEEVKKFINGYSLQENDDYFILPENSLEQYYPDPWKKSSEDVVALGTENRKVGYAKKVSGEISEAQFKNDMSVILNALIRCDERSFK